MRLIKILVWVYSYLTMNEVLTNISQSDSTTQITTFPTTMLQEDITISISSDTYAPPVFNLTPTVGKLLPMLPSKTENNTGPDHPHGQGLLNDNPGKSGNIVLPGALLLPYSQLLPPQLVLSQLLSPLSLTDLVVRTITTKKPGAVLRGLLVESIKHDIVPPSSFFLRSLKKRHEMRPDELKHVVPRNVELQHINPRQDSDSQSPESVSQSPVESVTARGLTLRPIEELQDLTFPGSESLFLPPVEFATARAKTWKPDSVLQGLVQIAPEMQFVVSKSVQFPEEPARAATTTSNILRTTTISTITVQKDSISISTSSDNLEKKYEKSVPRKQFMGSSIKTGNTTTSYKNNFHTSMIIKDSSKNTINKLKNRTDSPKNSVHSPKNYFDNSQSKVNKSGETLTMHNKTESDSTDIQHGDWTTTPQEILFIYGNKTFAYPEYKYVYPIVLGVCLLTTFLFIIILCKRLLLSGSHMSKASCLLLLAVAVADALTTCFALAELGYLYSQTDRNHGLLPYESCKPMLVLERLSAIPHAASTWFTAVLAIQRYMCVSKPFSAGKYISMNISLVYIVLISVLTILIHICRFFDQTFESLNVVISSPSSNHTVNTCYNNYETWVTDPRVYESLFAWTRICLAQFIPTLLIVGFVFLMIRSLRKITLATQRLQIEDSKSYSDRRQLSFYVAVVALIVFCVEISSGIFLSLNAWEITTGQKVISYQSLKSASVALDLILYVSYFSIFLIYCVMSEGFRTTFLSICCNMACRKSDQEGHTRNIPLHLSSKQTRAVTLSTASDTSTDSRKF